MIDYVHNPEIQNTITKSKFKKERGKRGGGGGEVSSSTCVRAVEIENS